MPRKPRAEGAGAVHHVVTNGTGGSSIVVDDLDRTSFVDRLSRAVTHHRWTCLAYCLLDTHLHLVVETPEPNLGLGMKWLKASYAQDFNYRHDRRGHLFGGRFYSKLIEREAHLLAAIVYVVLNPVRAGAVDRPEQWPWSSFASTAGFAPAPEFLALDRVLELFAGTSIPSHDAFVSAVADAMHVDDSRRGAAGSDPWGLTPETPRTAR